MTSVHRVGDSRAWFGTDAGRDTTLECPERGERKAVMVRWRNTSTVHYVKKVVG